MTPEDVGLRDKLLNFVWRSDSQLHLVPNGCGGLAFEDRPLVLDAAPLTAAWPSIVAAGFAARLTAVDATGMGLLPRASLFRAPFLP